MNAVLFAEYLLGFTFPKSIETSEALSWRAIARLLKAARGGAIAAVDAAGTMAKVDVKPRTVEANCRDRASASLARSAFIPRKFDAICSTEAVSNPATSAGSLGREFKELSPASPGCGIDEFWGELSARCSAADVCDARPTSSDAVVSVRSVEGPASADIESLAA